MNFEFSDEDYPPDPQALLGKWEKLEGVYICPMDDDGNRLGPMVGYAGKYPTDEGEQLQFVGDIYANYAKVEQQARTNFAWARFLSNAVRKRGLCPSVCLGAPMGGIFIASHLGVWLDSKISFAEKKVLVVATETEREKSKLVISRHDVTPNDKVIIVEDVCNNFSTTEELVSLVIGRGAKVVAIACVLNRSDRTSYPVSETDEVPVISLIHQHLPEYRQDDDSVVADIERGNLVPKPKEAWSRLLGIMKNRKR